jgi:hypothetical protein
MAMTTCGDCKAPVSTRATACPACGAPTRKPATTKRRLGIMLGVLFLGSAAVQAFLLDGPAGTSEAAAAPNAASSAGEAVKPVSKECSDLVEAAEREGMIRPAGMTREGMTMLVGQSWTEMPFSKQGVLAECASHYVAGGQNRWIKKIAFVNQTTGVTLGTIEADDYRVGP